MHLTFIKNLNKIYNVYVHNFNNCHWDIQGGGAGASIRNEYFLIQYTPQ